MKTKPGWMCCVFATLVIALYWTPVRAGDNLAGVWVREGDDYRGWVLEISDSGGSLEGRSLWVPGPAGFLAGFVPGEKKLRGVRVRGDGVYSGESMKRGEEGVSYEMVELSLSGPNRMIILADTPSGELGDRQRWRRVTADDPEFAFASQGRAVLAMKRERMAEAAIQLEIAARHLLRFQRKPQFELLANEIAWELATSSSAEILKPDLALRLLPYLGDWYEHVDTAAAVAAANGNFSQAIELQQKALQLISAEDADATLLNRHGLNGDNSLLRLGLVFSSVDRLQSSREQFEERLKSYEQRRVWRQTTASGSSEDIPTGVRLD